MEVLRITHRGIACLLPAKQVIRAAEEELDEEPIALWAGTGTEQAERRLILWTGAGERWIQCSTPVLMEMPTAGARPLSAVLRGAVGLPHLVGWTMLDEDLVWLVDLMRWSPRHEETQGGAES